MVAERQPSGSSRIEGVAVWSWVYLDIDGCLSPVPPLDRGPLLDDLTKLHGARRSWNLALTRLCEASGDMESGVQL